jgi:hypothetical protein
MKKYLNINHKILNIKSLSDIYIKLVVFISLFVVLNSNQTYSNDIELANLRDSINKYYYSFEYNKLITLLNESDNILKKYKKSYYANYYNGIIRYCLGRVIYNRDSDLAYDYFDSSLDMFESAYKIENNPISLAMISATYGKKSALSPISAIFFGQKAKNRIYDAYNLDSLNPKILLVAATHLMHVPGIYGGDKNKARRMLEKCLKYNNENKFLEKNSLELSWADNSEIYAYLAQLEILEENIESARNYMNKALAIKPNYGFVKIDLEKQITRLLND